MFPLEEISRIEAAPEDYRLIRRVPWTSQGVSFPIIVSEPVGDEVPVVVLDVETTGFDAQKDRVIELGLVKAHVSPSTGQVTSVVHAASMYEDPGFEIPEVITDITGITNEMVAGQHLSDVEVLQWFDDDPVVIAHNAGFDRKFFEARFPAMNGFRWACSISDISWRELGFEGNKLEYLVYKVGGFFEGHRASIDCLATIWLLHRVPRALQMLLEAEQKVRVKVDAVGSPFHSKDALKARGYHWDAPGKLWHTEVDENDLPEELAFLSMTYPSGGDRAAKTPLTSRERFKD